MRARLVLHVIRNRVREEEFELKENLRRDEAEKDKRVCCFSYVVKVGSDCHLGDVNSGHCKPLRFLDAKSDRQGLQTECTEFPGKMMYVEWEMKW